MKLYQEELMDHYRFPHNKGQLEKPDFSSGHHNPSCGDSIEMQGCVDKGVLIAVCFQGKGCVISQAAASMLTQAVKNKPLAQILSFDAAYMCGLIGIELGPMRMQCALLSLQALQQGIHSYQQKQESKDA